MPQKLVLLILSPLLIVVVPLLLICLPFYLLHILYRGLLRIWFEHTLGAEGKRILLIYSRSPNWHEYIESGWLPVLEPHVVTLNWSDRRKWGRWSSLPVLLFRHYKPFREYNPMVILMPESGKVRTIRFLVAFRDYKHGKMDALRKAESELFAFRETLGSRCA